MSIAHPLGIATAGEVIHRLVGKRAHHHIEQRHIDHLPTPGLLPLAQRRLDADHGIETGQDIRIGHADLLRRAVGFSGQVHDAAHALDDEIVSGPPGIGSILPEPGDRAIDQPRIGSRNAFVIETETLQAAELEVFDHHIGIRDQRFHPLEIVGIVEIGKHAVLAPVGGVEIGGVLAAIRPVHERRAPAARIVALGAFDLHDFGTQIGEGLPGPGSGKDAGEFDDLDAGQRCFAHGSRHNDWRGRGKRRNG